jgi:hypothetical protein
MTDELITPENLSTATLKAACDAAFMDASIDEDGDLKVKAEVTCFILPSEKKDCIYMIARFGFKPESSRLERLECANRINDGYRIVRASVTDSGKLIFDYYLPVAGGITKKAFILAVKRFCSIPHEAVSDCSHGTVA